MNQCLFHLHYSSWKWQRITCSGHFNHTIQQLENTSKHTVTIHILHSENNFCRGVVVIEWTHIYWQWIII